MRAGNTEVQRRVMSYNADCTCYSPYSSKVCYGCKRGVELQLLDRARDPKVQAKIMVQRLRQHPITFAELMSDITIEELRKLRDTGEL